MPRKRTSTSRSALPVAESEEDGEYDLGVGRLDWFSIGALKFDIKNPRLPENSAITGRDDPLLKFIAENYAPLEIAGSIARHGYFPSEPLIVVVEKGENVVVEGNRRLAALKLLSDPALAKKLGLEDAEDWASLARSKLIPRSVPAVVAESRDDVAPILGFRHISGIEPWDPWAQARFVAAFVDKDRKSFEEVAALIGEPESAVRDSYRNYRVARQLKKRGVDVSRVTDRFGVFTRAMQAPKIRRFIGAPAGAVIRPRRAPLKDTPKVRKHSRELVRWLVGTDTQQPLFTDSRKISEFAAVLGSSDGLAELRRTGDLEAAFEAAGGLRDRLVNRLRRADSYLAAAQRDISNYLDDDEVLELLASCETRLEELRSGEDL